MKMCDENMYSNNVIQYHCTYNIKYIFSNVCVFRKTVNNKKVLPNTRYVIVRVIDVQVINNLNMN